MLSNDEIENLIKNNIRGIFMIIKTNHSELFELINEYSGDTFSEKLYTYLGKTEYCECGAPKLFLSMIKGYRKTCGDKVCANAHREITNIDKYGYVHHAKNDSVKQKIKNTNMAKLGVSAPIQNTKIKQKIKETNLDRYGYENPFQNDLIKQKLKEKILDEYGVEHPMHNQQIKEKAKDTYKATRDEKYEGVHPMQTEEVKQKIKDKINEKYGVENYSQLHISKETIDKLNDVEWLTSNVSTHIDYLVDELGVSQNTIYVAFRKHGIQRTIKETYIEKEMYEFLSMFDIKIIKNTRSVIKPLELDFYIPEYNLAIECNGSYWHSELNGKDEKYHVTKTNRCEDFGIRLIHVWEHVWNNKKEIVKSIIATALQK